MDTHIYEKKGYIMHYKVIYNRVAVANDTYTPNEYSG